MRAIVLLNGDVALVDDADFPALEKFNWRKSTLGYVVGSVNGQDVYLHRFLLKPPRGKLCDHINGDTLDNRRVNLRVATHSQNRCNRGPTKRNTSGYKGVTWDSRKRRWKAQIGLTRNGSRKNHYLGTFESIEEAALAYNNAAVRVHGSFARLNAV